MLASSNPGATHTRLLCGLCDRRLQGHWTHGEAYHRCRYPDEYAATNQLAHPTNV